MFQCKYSQSRDTWQREKLRESLLISQTIYLMTKLMMEYVTVNVTLSTNSSKLCSFFMISVLGPLDKNKKLNLIILWCRITDKFMGNVTFSTYMWFDVFYALGFADSIKFHHVCNAPGPLLPFCQIMTIKSDVIWYLCKIKVFLPSLLRNT